MGFFDQIGKKAVETVQGAKDKTSKLSTEMKLKSQFADKKDKIILLYNEIGKEIYSNYVKGIENNTDTINHKCKEISNINEELKGINKELLALKNIKVCTSCGAQVPANSEFCPKCGVKQIIVVENAPQDATEVLVDIVPSSEVTMQNDTDSNNSSGESNNSVENNTFENNENQNNG